MEFVFAAADLFAAAIVVAIVDTAAAAAAAAVVVVLVVVGGTCSTGYYLEGSLLDCCNMQLFLLDRLVLAVENVFERDIEDE